MADGPRFVAVRKQLDGATSVIESDLSLRDARLTRWLHCAAKPLIFGFFLANVAEGRSEFSERVLGHRAGLDRPGIFECTVQPSHTVDDFIDRGLDAALAAPASDREAYSEVLAVRFLARRFAAHGRDLASELHLAFRALSSEGSVWMTAANDLVELDEAQLAYPFVDWGQGASIPFLAYTSRRTRLLCSPELGGFGSPLVLLDAYHLWARALHVGDTTLIDRGLLPALGDVRRALPAAADLPARRPAYHLGWSTFPSDWAGLPQLGVMASGGSLLYLLDLTDGAVTVVVSDQFHPRAAERRAAVTRLLGALSGRATSAVDADVRAPAPRAAGYRIHVVDDAADRRIATATALPHDGPDLISIGGLGLVEDEVRLPPELVDPVVDGAIGIDELLGRSDWSPPRSTGGLIAFAHLLDDITTGVLT